MKPIIGDQDFIKNLDDWLFKNTQPSAKWLSSNKNGIPLMFRNHGDWLYRGMFVDLELLMEIQDKGITLKTYTSWTKDERIANKFATDSTASGSKAKGNVSILIKKKIPPTKQILDIYNFAMFMGNDQLISLGVDDMSVDSAIKEQEVLCDKGLKITGKDIVVLKR